MTGFACNAQDKTPSWGLIDLFRWKVLPDKFGGGIRYIQSFKDAWVQHNKMAIRAAAAKYRMPPELLAGVCWIEVGGDPSFIDRVAFDVRSFDWSGPEWIDRNLTLTSNPLKTSFGPVSMQLRVAAKTLGLDPSSLSTSELSRLATCLQKDSFNIQLVAKHLRKLIDHDGLQNNPPYLSKEAIRIVGARYNRGISLSLKDIKENTSYGNFIVKFWLRFTRLLR